MTNLIFAYLTIGAVIAGIIVVHPRWIDGVRIAAASQSRAAIVFSSVVTVIAIMVAWPWFARPFGK